jgi:transposase
MVSVSPSPPVRRPAFLVDCGDDNIRTNSGAEAATRLTRFLEYPELELSNNCAANAIRPVALGRKNWIHIGSEEAGPRVAAIVSVVETCRRLKVPVREYLSSVLPGLATFPINRIAELTPIAWAARI